MQLHIQEWLAVETIVGCNFTPRGEWLPGTLAHAMFREEPVLFTTEDYGALARRRWPRHVIRRVEGLAREAAARNIRRQSLVAPEDNDPATA